MPPVELSVESLLLLPLKVDELKGLRRNMLVGITKDMQQQVTQVLDLKEMVVGEMLRDRSLMVSLFQRCGKAEFKFLVNRCADDAVAVAVAEAAPALLLLFFTGTGCTRFTSVARSLTFHERNG